MVSILTMQADHSRDTAENSAKRAAIRRNPANLMAQSARLFWCLETKYFGRIPLGYKPKFHFWQAFYRFKVASWLPISTRT
jgi:hypothetical protein